MKIIYAMGIGLCLGWAILGVANAKPKPQKKYLIHSIRYNQVVDCPKEASKLNPSWLCQGSIEESIEADEFLGFFWAGEKRGVSAAYRINDSIRFLDSVSGVEITETKP